MASYQYVYHMENVSKTYPGGKKCFENIHLNFLPGVKIGVVGVNGAGKSTLLKIIAGIDKDFKGEAWAAKGAKVGYLAQEPHLDPKLTAKENVMLGVAEQTAILERYNELAMNYSDETAEEMAALQDQIDAQNLWELAARRTMPMSKRFRVVNAAAWRFAGCSLKSPTCCFWTNRPTTLTRNPSPGCKST
jgi:ATPase subunit of ABC transporter with duplicated ATPase domains